jgi:hypothetical protein
MMVKHHFCIVTEGSCQPIISTERIEMTYFIGIIERDIASPVSPEEELYDVVLLYEDIVFDF